MRRLKLLIAAIFVVLCVDLVSGQAWELSHQVDELHAKNLDIFTLSGDFVKPPSGSTARHPIMVVRCSNGRFRSAYIATGSVVQPADDAHSVQGTARANVDLRIDSKKSDGELWEIGNAGTSLFMGHRGLENLLKNSIVHPGNPSKPTHQIVVGVAEYTGSRIEMRFGIPSDSSEIVLACGLEYDRKSRNMLTK
jgi:hypothetical protein